jgi:hypothetical protein
MGHLSAVVIIRLLKMVSAHKKCNAGVVLSGIAGLGKIKKACTRIRTETKIYTDKTPNKKSVLIRLSRVIRVRRLFEVSDSPEWMHRFHS